MSKEEKTHKEKDFTFLKKKHYYGLDPQETLARGKLEL